MEKKRPKREERQDKILYALLAKLIGKDFADSQQESSSSDEEDKL